MSALVSFSFFICLFTLIGIASVTKHQHTREDYLIAGRSVAPWLTALSAVATTNSGYMFVGMIGFTYQFGLSSIWLMVGWITGDMLASQFVHRRIREVSGTQNLLTYGGLLSQWHGTDFKRVRMLCGLITTVFLGAYAGAQIQAGGKAMHVLLEWPIWAGNCLGATIILAYCLAGGIRASIWTDAAQSIVMIGAMGLLLLQAWLSFGSSSEFLTALHSVDDTYHLWFPTHLVLGLPLGGLLFIGGWFFSGIGVIGQPHIMIRFMALKHSEHMSRTRLYYYGWYVTFFMMAIGVGLFARLLLSASGAFDAELAMPRLAGALLPDYMVGVILAGVFAATMSTADSQVLSCSAALSSDFFDKTPSYWQTKAITIAVISSALLIGTYGKSVYYLVVMAWSVLACSFAPLLVVYALGKRVTERVALLMISAGLLIAISWRAVGLSIQVNEALPAMLVAFLICWIGTKQQANPDASS